MPKSFAVIGGSRHVQEDFLQIVKIHHMPHARFIIELTAPSFHQYHNSLVSSIGRAWDSYVSRSPRTIDPSNLKVAGKSWLI